MLPPYQVFDVRGGKKVALIGVVTETTPDIVDAATASPTCAFLDEADAVNTYVPSCSGQGIKAIGVLIHEGGTQTAPPAPTRTAATT